MSLGEPGSALLPSPASLDWPRAVPSTVDGRGWPQGGAGMCETGLHGRGASSAPRGLFREEQTQQCLSFAGSLALLDLSLPPLISLTDFLREPPSTFAHTPQEPGQVSLLRAPRCSSVACEAESSAREGLG